MSEMMTDKSLDAGMPNAFALDRGFFPVNMLKRRRTATHSCTGLPQACLAWKQPLPAINPWTWRGLGWSCDIDGASLSVLAFRTSSDGRMTKPIASAIRRC